MALPQFVRRSYAGGTEALTLAEPIMAGTLSFAVTGDTTTWPTGTTGPFCAVLTLGLLNEEKVLCSGFNAMTGIVTVFSTGPTTGRGYDGTAATGHVPQTGTPSAQFTLVWTSREAREANLAVVNTIGKVTAAGDLLVGTGANALGRVGIGTSGYFLASTGSSVHWVDAAASFGLNSTVAAIHITGLNNRSAGTSTLAARADHNHGLSLLSVGTEWIKGAIPVTPTNPNITMKYVGVSGTTDTNGRIFATLPDAYTNCFIGAWVTLYAATVGVAVGAHISPAASSLSQAAVIMTDTTTGTKIATTSFNFGLFAIGC